MMKSSLFSVHAGITAKGCFTFSLSYALNSLDIFSAALTSNGLAIAVTPFDSSNCFELDFVLPKPGKHQLEIGIAEVMNGSVTLIGNASILVTLEVLQREGELLEWLGGETWKLVGFQPVKCVVKYWYTSTLQHRLVPRPSPAPVFFLQCAKRRGKAWEI